jgi:hypothetical protein
MEIYSKQIALAKQHADTVMIANLQHNIVHRPKGKQNIPTEESELSSASQKTAANAKTILASNGILIYILDAARHYSPWGTFQRRIRGDVD